MAKVAIVKCGSYNEKEVLSAVTKGIDLLGGIGEFVNPHEKILIKPNLLVGEIPDKCVTTHPAVFKAVASLFQKAGGIVKYGDSPGIGSSVASTKKTGLKAAAAELNIPLADFNNGETIFSEKAKQNKQFFIAKGVLEADGIISIPKMKTHALTKITGCVKNQFGCIPGPLKAEFHARHSELKQFGQMLVDLNNYVNPRLYIMDGIMAMEGNGPRSGDPYPMGLLLFSTDPIALDATFCRLIALDPTLVPTITIGQDSEAGTYLEKDIEVLGESIKNHIKPNFNVNRGPIAHLGTFAIFEFIKKHLIMNPIIKQKKCLKCGICIDVCPAKPKAIFWDNGDKLKIPRYDYSKCIRCYCCQEMCPERAIILKKTLLRKIIGFFIKGF